MKSQSECRKNAFKDLSVFLQMSPNVHLSRWLPLNGLRAYVRLLSIFYFGSRSHERRHLINALCKTFCLWRERSRLTRLAAKTFAGICEHYVEKLHNAYKPLPHNVEFMKRCVTIHGKDWLQEAYGRGKGCLLVTGHFGAVEFLPLALSVNGFKVAMILRYKDQKLKEASEAIGKARDGVLIDADETGALRTALSAVKNGRILIIQCDEFKHWKPCRDKQTRVFGVRIPQDRTINMLYRLTQVPTCLGLMKREKPGYKLLIKPIAEGQEERGLSDRSWRMLEHYIRKYPEQWYQWKAVSTLIPSLACQGAGNDSEQNLWTSSQHPVQHSSLPQSLQEDRN
jgi:KDO2-lipid IV(A) lauroyltransferase